MNFTLCLSLLALSCTICLSCKSNDNLKTQIKNQFDLNSKFEIVYEKKIEDFFNKNFFNNSGKSDTFEASGIEYFNNEIYIIFDSQADIFKATLDLDSIQKIHDVELINIFTTERQKDIDVEGIDIHPTTGKIRLIEEYFESNEGDKMFALLESRQISNLFSSIRFFYDFKSKTSGMEGLATRTYEGNEYLFILCEGRPCKKNMRDDAGTIEVFTEKFEKVSTVELFGALQLLDYSAIDIRNNRFALLSQKEGVLLLGRIEGLSDFLVDSKFQFPASYCNLEGVSFIDDNHLVLVSDRDNNDRKSCKSKERSIHLVKLSSSEDRIDRLPQ